MVFRIIANSVEVFGEIGNGRFETGYLQPGIDLAEGWKGRRFEVAHADIHKVVVRDIEGLFDEGSGKIGLVCEDGLGELDGIVGLKGPRFLKLAVGVEGGGEDFLRVTMDMDKLCAGEAGPERGDAGAVGGVLEEKPAVWLGALNFF